MQITVFAAYVFLKGKLVDREKLLSFWHWLLVPHNHLAWPGFFVPNFGQVTRDTRFDSGNYMNFTYCVGKVMLVLGFSLTASVSVGSEIPKKSIAFIAGKASHFFGEHEFNAGGELLVKALNKSGLVKASLHRDGWPKNGLLERPDAIIFYNDGQDAHVALEKLEELENLTQQGVGIMALHYAVHLPPGDGADAFGRWIGGYYESGYSTNPHWQVEMKVAEHPSTRGVKPFKVFDESYFNIRFNETVESFTTLLSATPPDSAREHVPHSLRSFLIFGGEVPEHITNNTGREEILAWAVTRKDGGRGLGFTGGHFHWNWNNNNFRKFVLNSIVWVAGAEVPERGVNSATPGIDELYEGQDERPLPFLDSKKRVEQKFDIGSKNGDID